MQQPKGFECQGKEEFVCKLNKSIYGLKQSPHCWNSTLDTYLKEIHFTQTTSDLCIYFWKNGKDTMFIGAYVDDIILAAKNEKQLKQVKEKLSNKFDSKDLGELKYFLGVKIEQNKEAGSIWIGQPAYIENRLKRLGIQDSKPTSTPADVSSKLQPAASQTEPVNQAEYQSAVGNLMYLAVSTRPDIAFTVNSLARIFRRTIGQR